MRKYLVVLLGLFMLLSVDCYAATEIDEYLTDEMNDILPENIIDTESGGGLNLSSLLSALLSGIKVMIEPVLKSIAQLLCVVLLSAIGGTVSGTFGSGTVSKCFTYLTLSVTALLLYRILEARFDEVIELLTKINSFMTGATASMTLLYVIGGNVTSAAVNDTAMGLILTVFEAICYYGIRPMLQICFGFCIISCISDSVDMKPVASFVRKTYTTSLIFVISFMTCVLSLQNMLTKGNDSLLLRTVKFATGLSVPLVGSSLGEAAATLGKSVTAIRSTFGVLAIISLMIMVLPVIISIFVYKMLLSFAYTVCSVFGMRNQAELISGGAELLGFGLAVSVSCSAMFIISIALLGGSVAALGG